MPQIVISLGSNLGDRRGHLEWAIDQLRRQFAEVRVSTIRETEPVDVPERQPSYLNAVLIGNTTADPEAVLSALLRLERDRGRTRLSFRAPRTLDLDLILYGTESISRPGLTVPHPRYRQRRFVLEPLAELAPDLRDPQTGETVAEMLAGLSAGVEDGDRGSGRVASQKGNGRPE
jgi:2-amino-4-hydroxy-6-hydroxymethyldihydropteridine diphosphokinase